MDWRKWWRTEGVWKWVTGPEELANGGAGTTFWNGLWFPTPYNFALWVGQTNQWSSRRLCSWPPGVGIQFLEWLNKYWDPSYQPKGYIVEYGGTSEILFKISASTTIIAQIINIVSSTRCGTELFKQLPQAEQYVGTILPQEEHPETGNSFTTTIVSTTTFYAEAGACESTRRAVVATKSITNYYISYSWLCFASKELLET
jgi:hypothetical protein